MTPTDRNNNQELLQIDSPRLILRRWQPDDAEALFRYASDAKVSELALWDRHTSVEMSREVIEKFFIPNPHTFAITDKTKGEPIGCIGIVPEGNEHYDISEREREVGYWLGRPHWGKGITTEALKALIRYCRDTLALKSLIITTDERNVASQRVAEKCGFSLIDRYEISGNPGFAYRLMLGND